MKIDIDKIIKIANGKAKMEKEEIEFRENMRRGQRIVNFEDINKALNELKERYKFSKECRFVVTNKYAYINNLQDDILDSSEYENGLKFPRFEEEFETPPVIIEALPNKFSKLRTWPPMLSASVWESFEGGLWMSKKNALSYFIEMAAKYYGPIVPK